MHEAERGLFELQQSRSLYVTMPDGHVPEAAVLLATVEGLRRQTLEQLRRLDRRPIRLAVTRYRAEAMGLTNGGRPCDMSLALNDEASTEQILRLSSTAGRHTADGLHLREASTAEVGGLTLARLGRLLPAIVSLPVDPTTAPEFRALLESGAVLRVTTAQIDAMAANGHVELTHVSEGPIPLEEAEDARFMFFREANGLLEHVAILIGDPEALAGPGARADPLGLSHGRSLR